MRSNNFVSRLWTGAKFRNFSIWKSWRNREMWWSKTSKNEKCSFSISSFNKNLHVIEGIPIKIPKRSMTRFSNFRRNNKQKRKLIREPKVPTKTRLLIIRTEGQKQQDLNSMIRRWIWCWTWRSKMHWKTMIYGNRSRYRRLKTKWLEIINLEVNRPKNRWGRDRLSSNLSSSGGLIRWRRLDSKRRRNRPGRRSRNLRRKRDFSAKKIASLPTAANDALYNLWWFHIDNICLMIQINHWFYFSLVLPCAILPFQRGLMGLTEVFWKF